MSLASTPLEPTTLPTSTHANETLLGDTIRVLCLDGGGTRGVMEVTILEEIERQTQKPISESFDFIAGTSIGGILALGLSYISPSTKKPYSAEELRGIFYKDGNRIFDQSWGWIRDIWNAWSAKYDSKGVEGVLKERFGDALLTDIEKPVLVVAYDVTESAAYPFFSPVANKKDQNFLLRDIGRATSAAPTYFPAAVIKLRETDTTRTFVDGGLAANNPSVPAALAAMLLFNTNNIFVVSLGCGFSRASKGVDDNGGLIQWAGPTIDAMFAANAQSSHRNMESLAKRVDKVNGVNEPEKKYSCYKRFNVDLTPEEGERDLTARLDDPSPAYLDKLVASVKAKYIDEKAPKFKKLKDAIKRLEKIGRDRTPEQEERIASAKWAYGIEPNVFNTDDNVLTF